MDLLLIYAILLLWRTILCQYRCCGSHRSKHCTRGAFALRFIFTASHSRIVT